MKITEGQDDRGELVLGEKEREKDRYVSRNFFRRGDRNDSDDEKFVWKRGRGISSQKFCIGYILEASVCRYVADN